jgi:UDP-N-acetylmuramate: L-alanyl-gamma-D-glutamyl-meso-diaminopimelate ligase
VPLRGAHNVRNTLAAMAVGAATGLDVDDMARALAGFKGVRRRLDLRGIGRDVSVFDDFAHHPTRFWKRSGAVRWSYPDRRVWAIFEPRSATSCRRIFQGRLRARVRRVGRRRGDPGVGLPDIVARKRTAVG